MSIQKGGDALAPAPSSTNSTGASPDLPGLARVITIGIAVLLLIYHPASALAAAGTIEGVIKDALQRPITGAQLRLESGAGQVAGRTTTDNQGRFAFTGVAARHLCRRGGEDRI